MIEHDEADVYDLWLQYFANGGNALQFDFETFLYGASEPSALDMVFLGFAIEELHTRGNPPGPATAPGLQKAFTGGGA